jgi:hypothetical protein
LSFSEYVKIHPQEWHVVCGRGGKSHGVGSFGTPGFMMRGCSWDMGCEESKIKPPHWKSRIHCMSFICDTCGRLMDFNSAAKKLATAEGNPRQRRRCIICNRIKKEEDDDREFTLFARRMGEQSTWMRVKFSEVCAACRGPGPYLGIA